MAPTTTLRAAAVQLNATEDVDRNLETADRLTREAVQRGAQLIVLPEKWTVLGRPKVMEEHAQTLDGPAVEWARQTAAELEIDLIAGSFVERRDGQQKTSNTSLHIGPDGSIQAAYRKLHMFDVEVDGTVYAESARELAGDEVVTTTIRLAAERRPHPRDEHLLRRPLPRALPGPQRARRRDPDRPSGVHARHHARPLGNTPARACDREPVFRDRRQPDRRASTGQPLGRTVDDHRSMGSGPGNGPGQGRGDRRRPRFQPARRRTQAPARA